MLKPTMKQHVQPRQVCVSALACLHSCHGAHATSCAALNAASAHVHVQGPHLTYPSKLFLLRICQLTSVMRYFILRCFSSR